MPKRKTSVATKRRKKHAKQKKRNEIDAEMHRLRRNEPEFREIEKQTNSAAHRQSRQSVKFRKSEKQRDAAAHEKSRQNVEFRTAEKQRDAHAHRRSRQIVKFRTSEKQRDVVSHQQVRENVVFRTSEKTRDAVAHQQSRKNLEFRTSEKIRDAAAHQQSRQSVQFRTSEKKRDAAAHQKSRQSLEFRTSEKQRDAAAHHRYRQSVKFRTSEKQRDAAGHQQSRQGGQFRTSEKQRDSAAHKKSRQGIQFRTAEKQRDAAAHQLARQSVLFRTPEKRRDAAAHQRSRQSVLFRTPEKRRDAAAHRKSREIPNFRKVERTRDIEKHRIKRKLLSSTYDSLRDQFEEVIRQTATCICSCCGGLWYKTSTVKTSESSLTERGLEPDMISVILSVSQEQHLLCITCKNSIYKKRIPKMCLSNGFQFPDLPAVLTELSPLEERLVSPRLPFLQIRPLGFERQSALRGNVVNVENNLDICATVLPRNFDDTSTVQVKLMRRMQYQVPYMHETIRPKQVYDAARKLITSEIYTAHGISLCEEWSRHVGGNWSEFGEDEVLPFLQRNNREIQDENDQPANELDQLHPAHELNETGLSMGADDSLVYRENDPSVLGIKIAPAEGKTPIPLFQDPDAEILSFPTVYGGQPRHIDPNLKISYTDIAKSELRRFDRRACKPTKLLYSFKKSFNEKARNAIQICTRKKVGNVTAQKVKDPAFLQKLIENDEGYAVFKHLRSSPSYWKEKAKTLIAMVRQLGKSTFFMSLSAAESKWAELIVALSKLVNRKDITEAEALNMTFEEISHMIREDPVTCIRHFDHRYRALFNLLLKPEAGAFSPYRLDDWFSRIEFQMRGSPHSHGLYWLKDAPEYKEGDEDRTKYVTEFIDQFITCERAEDGKMNQLIGYQLHKHSRTCFKKVTMGRNCRFGFPKPPMEITMILTPFPQQSNSCARQTAKDNYSKIKHKLNEMGRGFKENIPYQDFLDLLDLSHTSYLTAIRTSIKRPTVFLKRSTNASFINPYNRKILEAWGANMDIQYILDTYACAKYCAGYIMKAEGGVSKLLQEATREATAGNIDVTTKLKKYASILINGSEISAQEAAAFVLGIPNTNCSRDDVFINTSPPEERVRMLIPQSSLNKLEDTSDDVYVKGIIDHYTSRPNELEELCLADFASMYEFTRNQKRLEEQCEFGHEEIEVDDTAPAGAHTKPLKLLNSGRILRKRQRRKIIRYRHYGKMEDTSNYAREQIMLFVPWRDEQNELLNCDSKSKATEHAEIIQTNSKPYFATHDIDSLFTEAIHEEQMETEMTSPDKDVDVENEFAIHHSELNGSEQFKEIIEQIPAARSLVEKFLIPRAMPDEDYLRIMRSLNEKQRRFVLNILHLLKTQKSAFYHFLSGGAGVGKSHIIMAVVQSYIRFYQKFPSRNPDDICVLVAAPTGKAAFNIFGMTLHAAFRLPPAQYKGPLADLECGILNTLRMKMKHVKLIIVDEISMVSAEDLYYIDQRLRQIFQSAEPFAGKSILVVGHLRQLPPIGGAIVFGIPGHIPLAHSVGNHLWEMFSLFELIEIMRQKGEYEFCKALNNMAEGQMDDDDIKLIKSREISDILTPPSGTTHLFSTNKECEIHNSAVHKQLGTEGALSVAFDRIQGSGSEAAKRSLLEYAKTLDVQHTDGLRYETHLQIGAEYFVSTNINVQDGLFNGSTGILKRIDYGVTAHHARVPTIAWIEFDNSLVGANTRAKWRTYQQRNLIPSHWVPIERETRNLNKTGRLNVLQIIRCQIPLVASNGTTIHKAQGSSKPNVVLCTKTPLSRAKLYVGCSRATSKHGLFIDGIFIAPSPPKPNDKVTREMARLREIPFEFNIKFLQDYGATHVKLYYHNIQSFILHHLDITSDQCAMSSDYILLLEPHLLNFDDATINGFNVVLRENCQTLRNSEGAIVFSRSSALNKCNSLKSHFQNSHCIIVKMLLENKFVILAYKHPRYDNRDFFNLLRELIQECEQEVLVLGDFNIDSKQSNEVVNFFSSVNLEPKLNPNEPTTDYGTHLDYCFSNISHLEAGIYESYYSYHKPICVTWLR